MGNKNVITKDDCYLFGKGTHYEIYEKLGAHVTTILMTGWDLTIT